MFADVQLVSEARNGTPGAVERLLDGWVPTVMAWCVRLGGKDVNAEDAAQDVFELMLDRLGDLRDPAAFPAWAFGITRRVMARHRRHAWVRRWVPGAVVDAVEGRPDPLRRSEMSEVGRRVWTALETLPVHHREVLVLCDLEERADSEVADMLGVPRNTVKSRLFRARAALRGHLGDLAPTLLPDGAIAGSVS